MANVVALQGPLYRDVIEEVIREVRQDFEESGVDEITLQELKKVCECPFSVLNHGI